ncbi:hypothetical protein KCV87_34475 [Actinosynnema pretiosum subsp. pretiosum]|uniref:Uncharacterized protein n=1 Tax=Actinosynnema pretiosum subsp. pretiosum TaxID=103721 RepID=A0AA45L6A3_9PSEU|nr:hypothetical protein APASM_4256 [Actinosynnema pretiosum subsp. pretiosum]QUF04359.1 hypothetical protein KCV87_34475 [Actinosynnema pretiosum subsp. pretiosum]
MNESIDEHPSVSSNSANSDSNSDEGSGGNVAAVRAPAAEPPARLPLTKVDIAGLVLLLIGPALFPPIAYLAGALLIVVSPRWPTTPGASWGGSSGSGRPCCSAPRSRSPP